MADWASYIALLRREQAAAGPAESERPVPAPDFEFGDALESSVQKKVADAKAQAEMDPFRIAPHAKKEKAETAGPDWFNVPKANLSEEDKRDWDILRMRGAIGKTSGRTHQLPEKPPEFLQFGVVVGSSMEGPSGRLRRKLRGRTIAESLAKDADFRDFLDANVQKLKKKKA